MSEGRKGFATDPRYTHIVFRAGWSLEVETDVEAEAEVPAFKTEDLWDAAAGTSLVVDEEL